MHNYRQISNRILVPVLNLIWDDHSKSDDSKGEYKFGCFSGKIVPFLIEDYLNFFPCLSIRDIERLGTESQWSIELIEYDGFKQDLHLLVMAFRIAFDYPLALHSYLYPDENPGTPFNPSIKMRDIFSYEEDEARDAKLLLLTDLKHVEDLFTSLKEMSEIQGRAHNSLFFLMRGMFDSHVIGSIFLWSAALECIFGLEKDQTKAAEKICKRITNYLTSNDFPEARIKKSYNYRSRLIHGQMHDVWDSNSKNNVAKSRELWKIVRACFHRLLVNKDFNKLAKNERELYLDSIVETPEQVVRSGYTTPKSP